MTKNPTQLLVLALIAISLSGCATTPPQNLPKPTISEYFQTIGGGFISSGKSVKYALEFKVKKPVNGILPWYASIEFENPENLALPIFQIAEYAPGDQDISVRSQDLKLIANHRTYRVDVKAYSDPSRTQLVTNHTMLVRFDIPDELANSWGLKLLK